MKESFVDKIKKTTVGKKERCLTPENLAETGVRLRGLEKKYRLIVRMETEKVRTAREKRKEDERAQLKLKNRPGGQRTAPVRIHGGITVRSRKRDGSGIENAGYGLCKNGQSRWTMV